MPKDYSKSDSRTNEIVDTAQAAGLYIKLEKPWWALRWKEKTVSKPKSEAEYNLAIEQQGQSLLALKNSIYSSQNKRHGWSHIAFYVTAFAMNVLAAIQAIQHGARPIQYMNINNRYLNDTVIDPYYNGTIVTSRSSESLRRFDLSLAYIFFLLPLVTAFVVFIGRQIRQTPAQRMGLFQVGQRQFDMLIAEREDQYHKDLSRVGDVSAANLPSP